MSWCSKWIHGNEWPEGVLVTLGRDGNVQRYVPDCERDKLQAENDKLREKLKEETAENKWAREFLNGIAERIRQANAHSLVNYVETIEDQNAKLRELVRGLDYCASESYGMCARTPIGGGRPFTCCPLYDFDAKEYRCKKLKHELGVDDG